jgi:ornithine--oxo-acid transaminase
LREHAILVAFTEYNRNVIRLEPPLIARAEHIDGFLRAFEEVLATGVTKIVARYARKAIA